MYAIIKTGGKQYRVAEGDVITIEKLEAAANDSVTFEEVLTVVNDGDVKVGAPLVNGAKVTGTVLEHGKGKKIVVYKYKAKKNYRRKQGHRQPYTKVEITSIKIAAKKATAEKKETTAAAKKTTKKVEA